MVCRRAIAPGDLIVWSRRPGARGAAWHAACRPTPGEAPPGEVPPGEAPPGEVPPGEAPPGEAPPGEAPPGEAPPGEVPPSEAPPGEPSAESSEDSLARAIARAIAPYVGRDKASHEVTINIRGVGGDTVRSLDESVHAQFETLLRMVLAQRAVYLYGSPGGGKSHAASQAARALDLPYVYTALSPSSMPHEIFGYLRATDGAYVKGVATEWALSGGVLCLDELDNASSTLLVTLNNMLEARALYIPGQGMVALHNDAYLIGTGNTSGRGSHPAFPERRPFDMAFATRFAYLKWEYDWDLARNILSYIVPDKADAICTWCASATAYAEEHELPIVVGPRSAIVLARLLAAGIAPADALDAAVWRGAGDDAIAGMPAFPRWDD